MEQIKATSLFKTTYYHKFYVVKMLLIILVINCCITGCSMLPNHKLWLEQIESARTLLNEHNNEDAYRTIENIDSIFLREAAWDILGVLYYEGVNGIMDKDIDMACEILTQGERPSDSLDIYPSLAQRLHIYSGNLYLINSLQNKFINFDAASNPHFLKNNHRDGYFDFYRALNEYKKAKELESDFQLLDGLIDVLMRYTEAADYYLANGELVDSEYRISQEGIKWQQDGMTSIYHNSVDVMSIRDRKGIFMDRKTYNSRYVPYNFSLLIHDVNSTDELSLEVKRFDNDFTIYLGKIKYTFNPQTIGSFSETRDDGLTYNSGDKLNL